MNALILRWCENLGSVLHLNATHTECFSIQGVMVTATSNPDVLSFSVATELPIWLENLPTSLNLAADIQRDYPGIKVLYEDDPENDGLVIRFVHEAYITGMEDIAPMFAAVHMRLSRAFEYFLAVQAKL
ncbi:MAG: hypothetical protein ACOYLC_00430 [Armatimonadaceae bacterium]